MKIILLLLSCTLLFNISCGKEETSVEEEIIVQGENDEEKEPEKEDEEEEEEEETPDNPDLDLVGGQAPFNITPNGGTISGGTSVKLKLIHDDLKTTIPNEEMEYQIVWKTNGIYGHFEDELIEVTTLEVASITFTSTNTEIMNGEEKFVATLYARPKGSEAEFELIGSSAVSLTITNETNKEYSVLGASYWLVDSYPEGLGTRNVFYLGYTIPYDEDAVSYQLAINEIIYDGFPFEQNSGRSWTNESQPQFTYFDEEANAYRVWLLSNGTNTSNQPSYDINYNNTINVSGTAQLTITYADN